MAEKTTENKYNYIKEWKKKNMKYISGQYKKEFVEEFREACSKLGIKQSQVFKKAMEEVIKKSKEI